MCRAAVVGSRVAGRELRTVVLHVADLGSDIYASICAAIYGGASFSLYWMNSDLSHLIVIVKFPRRDGPDRRLVGVS